MRTDEKRRKLEREIRKDLLAQLDKDSGKYHIDLVDDYMELWHTKCLLQEDIRKHGVRIEYVNARGEPSEKKNESVDQLLKVNAQMLKILQELGVKPKLKPAGEDDAL
jgi:phage terminase small subunit